MEKWNSTKIMFTHENHTFKMTPKSCYRMKDSKIIVIMYLIQYINRVERINKIAEIPYYVSDGHTNEFRANMLFPFLCFTDKDSPNPVCPNALRKDLAKHGLMKLNLLRTIDTISISKKINELFVEKFEQRYPKKGYMYLNYIINQQRLDTIFGRLGNVLDLVVAITSPVLNEYDPSFTDEQIRCFIPVRDPNLKYDLSVCNGATIEEMMRYNKESVYASILYRRCLLDIFYEIKLNMDPFMKYIPTSKKIIDVSYDEFNQLMNVCNKKRETQDSLHRYREISILFHSVLHSLPTIKYILPNDELDTIRELYQYNYTNSINNNELDFTLHIWNANCKKKDDPEDDIEYDPEDDWDDDWDEDNLENPSCYVIIRDRIVNMCKSYSNKEGKKKLHSKRNSTKRNSTKRNTKRNSTKRQSNKNMPRYDLQQFTKKYTDRPSPPYPANKMCGQTRLGNDDNLYISKANKNGICSWKRV